MTDLIVDDLDIARRLGSFRLGPFSLPRFEPGVTVIVGDNGAGKSTLFDAIQNHETYAGAQVAFLPQTFSLPPFSKVRDACEFVARRRLRPGSDRDAEVDRVLGLVDLADKGEARFRTLSGGMHRRVGIAMSIIGDPDLLILDEPTAGLDLTQREHVLSAVTTISDGAPVLMSSHISDDLETTAGRIIVLTEGQLSFDGSRESYLAHAEAGAPSAWTAAYRTLASGRTSGSKRGATESQ